MRKPELLRLEIERAEMAVRLAGDREKPALLSDPQFSKLLGIVPERDRHPRAGLLRDHPGPSGVGGSEPDERPSFSRFADMIDGLLARLGAGSFHLYLHDYGAAVRLHLATRAPRRVRSLIVQNANAHESGMGPQWSATRSYWHDPTPEWEAEATAHLTFEGTRDQHVGGVPRDIAECIESPAVGGGLADHVAPRPARDAACAGTRLLQPFRAIRANYQFVSIAGSPRR